jgi:acyl transferase domain-containing protein
LLTKLDRGAEIVVHRTAALVECDDAGAMVAARVSGSTAERLVARAAAGAAAVVAENSPSDLVIAGTVDGISAVRGAAAREGISVALLKSSWAPSPPPMAAPAAALAQRIGAIGTGALEHFRFLCSEAIAAMPDEISTFVRHEETQCRGD